MQRLKQPMPPQSRHRQRGISLIESLIALVITALGILGVVGVQMRTLTDTSSTVRRAQAIRLIEDLSERMKVNPNAIATLDNYLTTFTEKSSALSRPSDDCANGCTRADQARYDRYRWKQAVETLPTGKAQVFIPPAEASIDAQGRRQLGVMIAWRENERDELYEGSEKEKKKSIDATQALNATGSLVSGAGSAATCPDKHTCHLQYIPVSSRCAPYKAGNGPLQYFCSGA